MQGSPMILSEDEVRKLLRMEDLIPAMAEALRDLSAGVVLQPLRTVLPVLEHEGFLGVMPACGRALGAKLVTFYPQNKGIPTHHAMILLFRPETGEPLAVMDGRLITEMRTAAVSAAATKYLAPPEAQVLALLGSGVQAQAHLEALTHLHRYDEIRVWSRTPEHAADFAGAHRGVTVARSAEAAVRDADVVVTATNALEPILNGAWLKPGAHVNTVGSPRPNWRELDDAAMRNTLVVDSREAALQESGDVILSGAAVYAEIGEIFAGLKSAPASETTIFKSVGLAIEDVATARLVYDLASAASSQ